MGAWMLMNINFIAFATIVFADTVASAKRNTFRCKIFYCSSGMARRGLFSKKHNQKDVFAGTIFNRNMFQHFNDTAIIQI